jgi:hypothetical protein
MGSEIIMTTICSYCGKEINEENEVNKGKKYLLCKCGAYIPRGAHSYNDYKEVKNMAEKKGKKEKVDKVKSKAQIVRELLAKGKSHEDIEKETGIKVSYINSVIAYQDKKKK